MPLLMKKIFLFLFLLVLVACNSSPQTSKKKCTDCHQFHLDPNHRFSCPRCHQGHSPATDKEEAHQGLIASPASPENMEKFCGPCHAKEVKRLKKSLHFTLAGEVNLVRGIFGLSPVKAAVDLPTPSKITTLDDLVSDLLRRRCLRCHLFYQGDDYAETRRGRGCAACHLFFAQGQLQRHEFLKTPPDRLCLHCHYGNHVGWDYYGMFEHDYPYQFRSPLIEGKLPPRPWGIEFHELTPDVHLKHGMSCLACHHQEEIMGDGHYYRDQSQAVKVRCLDCHQIKDEHSPYHHPKVLSQARCSTCHALWSFQDQGWHLILTEDPDWDEWSEFMVQGPSEIESLIISYLTTGQARAEMKDKFTGTQRPGVWFLAFGWRQFEKVPFGLDQKGRLAVVRPLLDLHLSYVNAEDDVIFDNFYPALLKKTPQKAYVAYGPHTIGPGDTFRAQEVLKRLGLFHEFFGVRRR